MSNIDYHIADILRTSLSAISNELEKLSNEISSQLATKRAVTRQTARAVSCCIANAQSTLRHAQSLQEHVNLSSLNSLKDKVRNRASVLDVMIRNAPIVSSGDY